MIITPAVAMPATTWTQLEDTGPKPVFLGRIVDAAAPGTQHRLLASPRPLGPVDGWASLAEAIAGASLLTAGAQRPGAAVFELGGRFHARALQVLSRVVDPTGDFSPWTRHSMTWLETRPAQVAYQPYRTSDEARALRALVDGSTVVCVTPPH